MDTCFKLNIEQGPILDGVVTGGHSSNGVNVLFDGETAHIGPTPMDLRADANMAPHAVIRCVDC